MSTFTRLLLIIVLSLMLVHPVFGQDTATPEEFATATPVVEPTIEPTPVVEPPVEPAPPDVVPTNAFNSLLLALVAIIMVGGAAVVFFGRMLYLSTPAPVRPSVKGFLEGILGAGRDYVTGTPDMSDDELFKIIERYVRDVLKEQLPAIIAAEVARQSTRGYTTPSS